MIDVQELLIYTILGLTTSYPSHSLNLEKAESTHPSTFL